ncbi:glycosyltransferase [Polynucleobacter sp. UB-Siik-W21]|uniref:glycosyltransferase n=1 Tax=Polynucleobacter sp. UB-Siik-W21 TaxID=1855646 RepID=UPI001BFDD537|nr:glycosyltransferase [Polynucleobacter sp. UB-Siik-W21]QWD70700.1 glycosyltransferase [Polynucleobacter sp. UB-Siik-W21]
MSRLRFPIEMLGQSGFRIELNDLTLYVDPYLSNSVYEQDSNEFVRMKGIARTPDEVVDADYVLITHEHLDHCDPNTVLGIAKASPEAIFWGPRKVLMQLTSWGIDADRLMCPEEHWKVLDGDLKICAIPSAHPEIERDDDNKLTGLGYIIDCCSKLIYIAGDTLVHEEIIDVLRLQPKIDVAFLPVNEDNYYRRKKGIVGNMSVREAFQFASDLGIRAVVPVHWDMFEINSTYLEEIKLIYEYGNYKFELLVDPKELNLSGINTSIIIRTLNEERYLSDLLATIKKQSCFDETVEIIVVDSGSTDKTLSIAEHHNCKILRIPKKTFTFGNSLNKGCEQAAGKNLVFISGHCVPADKHWLKKLCAPLGKNEFKYVYGRQIGGNESYFSEKRIFEKMFPPIDGAIVDGLFCNNANAAMLKSEWLKHGFDAEITGLEDLDMANKIKASIGRVGYISQAIVYHYHKESWKQVARRFEREAYALQKIKINIHLRLVDAIYYFLVSVFSDYVAYLEAKDMNKNFLSDAVSIVKYRLHQYVGSWKGSNRNRRPTQEEKELFFYPLSNEKQC